MTKIRAIQRKNVLVNNGLNANSSPTIINNNNNSKRIGSGGVYRPLNRKSGNNDDYIDSQFQKPPVRVPIKAVALATFLCMAGATLFILGLLVSSGQIDAKFSDRVWPTMIMGCLMFIPGAYHVKLLTMRTKELLDLALKIFLNLSDKAS